MGTIKVNMSPNPLDVQTIHASQNDTEAREWEFELHNNGELIDTSGITEQLFFKAYKGGTEQILPENTSTPATSPFKGDIKYPQGLLTDQEFTYRQSPTESDVNAKIQTIYGNTLKWNQLVQNGNFASINAWSSIMGTRTASNNELTYQPTSIGNVYYENQVLQQGLNVPTNHVLFLHCETYAPYDNGFYMSVRTNYVGQANVGITNVKPTPNSWSSFSKITKLTNTMTDIAFYWSMDTRYTTDDTVKLRNVNIIDLTQMFGQTKAEEILAMGQADGIAYFRSLYPLPYYQYDSGSLLPFRGEGLKTVGFNQFNKETATDGKRVNNTGAVVDRLGQSVSDYIKVISGQRYYLNHVLGSSFFYTTASYDANKTFVSVLNVDGGNDASGIITIPQNIHYIRVNMMTELKDSVCVNISNAELNGTYEPYTSSTLSLPISTYFPTGMKSAGTVYDELTENKAITRVGAVDLGTLDWIGETSVQTGQFRCPFTIYGGKYQGECLCPNYTNNPTHAWNNIGNMQIGIGNSKAQPILRIRNESISSVEALKTSLNGVYLYYELATPTETSFTTASLVTENAEIPLSNDDGTLIGKCTEQLSENPGFIDAKIKLSDADGECYSNKLQLHVERSPQ